MLAQTANDAKFLQATVVKRVLDGYRVRYEDGSEQDVLQADMAFDQPPDPAKLTLNALVAAASFGDFYPGRIFEIADGSYVVAWESSGADPVALEDIRLRMVPRKDPRPSPPPPPVVAATPGTAADTKPAGTPPPPAPASAQAPGGKSASAPPPPPMAGAEDNPLLAILGMAGDRFLMKYTLTAPTKSDVIAAKTALADISLEIPQDYVPVGLDFKIKNKSGKAFTIDWAKCHITSFAGKKHPVYHGDFDALEDIPAVEKPTELAAGAEESFSMPSRDGIVTTFHPAHWEGAAWIEKWTEILNNKLFYGDDLPNALSNGTSAADQAKDLELLRKNVIGKSFKVGIALVQGGTPTVVEFSVRIDDLQKSHEANMLDSIGH